MFKSISCFLRGKRIIELKGCYIAQVYELGAGWCGIDKEYNTWALEENLFHCLSDTFQEANDHLLNYLDYKKELSAKLNKTVHSPLSTPRFWRVLRKKND